MPLTTEPVPFALDGLTETIRRASSQLPELRGIAGDLRLVGPFRCFVGDPAVFAAGATRRGLQEAGWRGLLTGGDNPLALVEIHPPSRRGDDRPAYGLRGREPAQAFAAVLEAAQAYDERTPGPSEVRFLSFPSLFLTALWVTGRRAAYIPTRLDAGPRPDPQVYTRKAFVGLVARRLSKMAGRRLAGFDAGDEPSNAVGALIRQPQTA